MKNGKTTFALFFGNRGFFPASLIKEARADLPRVLKEMGQKTLMLSATATRHGAVETPQEGELYARFLKENEGKFGGVILCLPNFGDETGAIAALKDAGVPILIHAYPDELDKMEPALRRDAFCGKFSIMDVFCQYGLKFTALRPHTVAPSGEQFRENVEYFDKICRVVNGMKGLVVGAIGARTTAFKTVRIDEIALQRNDITVETIDLSDVFARVKALSTSENTCKAKRRALKRCASWDGVPDEALDTLVKLGVVIDRIIEEYRMDALALRCWIELQEQLCVSPCVLLGELNDRGVSAACEVDVGNAVTMHALALASGGPPTCLDWNNNYGDDDEKCILFHCGPVPPSMMTGRGHIVDHAILANAVGEGCSYGCNVGRITPDDFTFGSMVTEAGRLRFYLGQGTFTNDPIPEDFFGCAGVARIERLQDVLLYVGRNGYRHHVSVTPGLHQEPVREALSHYLGFDAVVPQE
jgi:L-fucose isomerase-like protein